MRAFFLGMFFFILFLLLWNARIALSFPQNTRLGYTNCKSCHYAPTGGGALKPYGKSTAAELSTWQTGIEPRETKWISSGDLRYLSIQRETDTGIKTENKFLMQGNLEFGYEGDYFDAVVEVGQYYSRPRDIHASYKHYIQTEILGLGIRFGKFAPAFGLNTDDHTLPGRNSIGFDSRNAGVNTELSHAAEWWNFSTTFIQGCQKALTDIMQKNYCKDSRYGFAGQVGIHPVKNIFLSGSLAWTDNDKGESQEAYGLAWVIGNKNIYSMGELTHNSVSNKSEDIGWVDLLGSFGGFELGGTYRQYATEEVPGFKIRWLPIDHLELSGVYLTREEYDEFIAVGHLYF